MTHLKTTNKSQILELLPEISQMREDATMESIYCFLKESNRLSCSLSTFKRIFYSLHKSSNRSR